MKWRTTLLLLTLTVGVGAYVSLYELKQPTPEQRPGLAKRILRLEPQQITALSVELPDAKVTLKKDGEVWHLTSPLAARAERSLVEQVLGQLEWLEAERVLSGTKDHPLDRAAYGLAPAKGTFIISTQHDSTTLLFGEASAIGDNRYVARTDRPDIFVADPTLFNTLNQPTESYRSHELVGLDLTSLAHLAVSSSTRSYALTKEQGQWKLVEPVHDAADAMAVGALINQVSNLRIERIVSEQTEISAHPEWGFQTPSAKVTLAWEGRPTPVELTFGGGVNDNVQQRYAMRSDEPTLYAVNGMDVEAFLKDPETFRAKPPVPPATGAEGSTFAPGSSAATPSSESALPSPPASTKTDHAPAASR
jgi:hypothetical protein